MVPPSPGICMLKCSNITVNKSATTGYRKQLSPSLMQSVKIEDPIWHKIQSTSTQKKHMQLAPENSVSRIIGIRANSLTSMPSQSSQWSWNAGSIESINSVNQLSGLWTPRSKWAPTAPGRKYEQDDNDDTNEFSSDWHCRVLVSTKKEVKLSSAFQLISLFSFSCVRGPLGVSFKSDWIKSNHVKSIFPMFSCAKRFCVLPSDPPAQVVQHVHFQGAGTDVRCLPHKKYKNEVDLDAPYCWYIDVIHQVVRSCNSAKKWSQFVPISFNKNIYIG